MKPQSGSFFLQYMAICLLSLRAVICFFTSKGKSQSPVLRQSPKAQRRQPQHCGSRAGCSQTCAFSVVSMTQVIVTELPQIALFSWTQLTAGNPGHSSMNPSQQLTTKRGSPSVSRSTTEPHVLLTLILSMNTKKSICAGQGS